MFESSLKIKKYNSKEFIEDLNSLKSEAGEEDFIGVLVNVIEKYDPSPVDMLNRLQLLHYYSDDANRKMLIGKIINLISG